MSEPCGDPWSWAEEATKKREAALRRARRRRDAVLVLGLPTLFGLLTFGWWLGEMNTFRCGGTPRDALHEAHHLEVLSELRMLSDPNAPPPRSAYELKRAGMTKRANKDPWGNDYCFRFDGERVSVCSAGRDGHFGNEDDICGSEQWYSGSR
jgi:hypothetical protein